MIDLTRRDHDFHKDLQPKQFRQVTNNILLPLRSPYPECGRHLAKHPGFRRIGAGKLVMCY